ncbi:hypothetical protein ABIA33_007179 [Streptacidiphilus sp. MAP12-16]
MGSERRGTWVYYWVLPPALAKLSSLLQAPDTAAITGPAVATAIAGGSR